MYRYFFSLTLIVLLFISSKASAQETQPDFIYGYASYYDTGCASREDAMKFLNTYTTNSTIGFTYDVSKAASNYKTICNQNTDTPNPADPGSGNILYQNGAFRILGTNLSGISCKGVYNDDTKVGTCAITSGPSDDTSGLYIPAGYNSQNPQIISGTFNITDKTPVPAFYLLLGPSSCSIKNKDTCAPKIYLQRQFRQSYWTTRKAIGHGLFAALIAYDRFNDSGSYSGKPDTDKYNSTAYVDAMYYLSAIAPKIPYNINYRWEEIDWEYIPQDTGSATPSLIVQTAADTIQQVTGYLNQYNKSSSGLIFNLPPNSYSNKTCYIKLNDDNGDNYGPKLYTKNKILKADINISKNNTNKACNLINLENINFKFKVTVSTEGGSLSEEKIIQTCPIASFTSLSQEGLTLCKLSQKTIKKLNMATYNIYIWPYYDETTPILTKPEYFLTSLGATTITSAPTAITTNILTTPNYQITFNNKPTTPTTKPDPSNSIVKAYADTNEKKIFLDLNPVVYNELAKNSCSTTQSGAIKSCSCFNIGNNKQTCSNTNGNEPVILSFSISEIQELTSTGKYQTKNECSGINSTKEYSINNFDSVQSIDFTYPDTCNIAPGGNYKINLEVNINTYDINNDKKTSSSSQLIPLLPLVNCVGENNKYCNLKNDQIAAAYRASCLNIMRYSPAYTCPDGGDNGEYKEVCKYYKSCYEDWTSWKKIQAQTDIPIYVKAIVDAHGHLPPPPPSNKPSTNFVPGGLQPAMNNLKLFDNAPDEALFQSQPVKYPASTFTSVIKLAQGTQLTDGDILYMSVCLGIPNLKSSTSAPCGYASIQYSSSGTSIQKNSPKQTLNNNCVIYSTFNNTSVNISKNQDGQYQIPENNIKWETTQSGTCEQGATNDATYTITIGTDNMLSDPIYYNNKYLLPLNRQGRATSFGHFIVPKGTTPTPRAQLNFGSNLEYYFTPLFNNQFSSSSEPMNTIMNYSNKNLSYSSSGSSSPANGPAWDALPGPVNHDGSYHMYYDKSKSKYYAREFNWYLIYTSPNNICYYIAPYSSYKTIDNIVTDINGKSLLPIKCEAGPIMSGSNYPDGSPDDFFAVGDMASNSTTNGQCKNSPKPAECMFATSKGEVNRVSSYLALLQQWIIMNTKSFSGMPWTGMWQQSLVKQFYVLPYDGTKISSNNVVSMNMDDTNINKDNWLYNFQKNFELNIDRNQYNYGTTFFGSTSKAVSVSFYDTTSKAPNPDGDLLTHEATFNSSAAFLTIQLPNDVSATSGPPDYTAQFNNVFPKLSASNITPAEISVVNGLQIKTWNQDNSVAPFCTYTFSQDGSSTEGGSYFLPYGAILDISKVKVDFSDLNGSTDDARGMYNCLGGSCNNGCPGSDNKYIQTNLEPNEEPLRTMFCKQSIRQYCLLSENTKYKLNLHYDHLEKMKLLNNLGVENRTNPSPIIKSSTDDNNNVTIFFNDTVSNPNIGDYNLYLANNYATQTEESNDIQDIDAKKIEFKENANRISPSSCSDSSGDTPASCTFNISNNIPSPKIVANNYYYYQITGSSNSSIHNGGFIASQGTPNPSTKCSFSNLTANPNEVTIGETTKVTISANLINESQCNANDFNATDTIHSDFNAAQINGKTISWSHDLTLTSNDTVSVKCDKCGGTNQQSVIISAKSAPCIVSINATDSLTASPQTFTPAPNGTSVTFTLSFDATNCSPSDLQSKNTFVLNQLDIPPNQATIGAGTLDADNKTISWNVSGLQNETYKFDASCDATKSICTATSETSNQVTITPKTQPSANCTITGKPNVTATKSTTNPKVYQLAWDTVTAKNCSPNTVSYSVQNSNTSIAAISNQSSNSATLTFNQAGSTNISITAKAGIAPNDGNVTGNTVPVTYSAPKPVGKNVTFNAMNMTGGVILIRNIASGTIQDIENNCLYGSYSFKGIAPTAKDGKYLFQMPSNIGSSSLVCSGKNACNKNVLRPSIEASCNFLNK